MEPKPTDLYELASLEAEFASVWHRFAPDAPEPVREHRFHPDRGWRFDFAWPEHLVAVECEGGIYTGQAHGSISGILRDIGKYNAATELGWRVFRATRPMLNDWEQAALFVSMVCETIDCEVSEVAKELLEPRF